MTARDSLDRDGLTTLALTLVICIVLAGVPLALGIAWVYWTGLRAGREAAGDLLVVFGKRLSRGAPDADYRARLLTAAALAAERPAHRILLLGGRTAEIGPTEAEAGALLLRELPAGARLSISLEQTSSSTLTNLCNLRGLLGGLDVGCERQRLTLISNRYHLARVSLMAASLSLSAVPCAAEDRRSGLRPATFIGWLVEGLYVVWFVTGKLWAIVTGNRRMLGRVT